MPGDKTIVTKKTNGSMSKIFTCEFGGETVCTVPKGLGPTMNLLNITIPKGPNLLMNIVIPQGLNIRMKVGSKMIQVTVKKAQDIGELKRRAESEM